MPIAAVAIRPVYQSRRKIPCIFAHIAEQVRSGERQRDGSVRKRNGQQRSLFGADEYEPSVRSVLERILFRYLQPVAGIFGRSHSAVGIYQSHPAVALPTGVLQQRLHELVVFGIRKTVDVESDLRLAVRSLGIKRVISFRSRYFVERQIVKTPFAFHIVDGHLGKQFSGIRQRKQFLDETFALVHVGKLVLQMRGGVVPRVPAAVSEHKPRIGVYPELGVPYDIFVVIAHNVYVRRDFFAFEPGNGLLLPRHHAIARHFVVILSAVEITRCEIGENFRRQKLSFRLLHRIDVVQLAGVPVVQPSRKIRRQLILRGLSRERRRARRAVADMLVSVVCDDTLVLVAVIVLIQIVARPSIFYSERRAVVQRDQRRTGICRRLISDGKPKRIESPRRTVHTHGGGRSVIHVTVE